MTDYLTRPEVEALPDGTRVTLGHRTVVYVVERRGKAIGIAYERSPWKAVSTAGVAMLLAPPVPRKERRAQHALFLNSLSKADRLSLGLECCEESWRYDDEFAVIQAMIQEIEIIDAEEDEALEGKSP